MTTLRVLACLILCLSMHLSAATAKDMIGAWSVDGAATWDKMKAMPQIAAAPAAQQEQIKASILGMAAGMTYEVTADKIIGKMGEQTKIDTYKVLSIDGEILHTETIDPKGVVEKSDILIGKDGTLTISSLDKPGMVMVLKKAVAAAPAK